MANMSYCRFQNTLIDFEDCKEEFLAMVHGVDGSGEYLEPLSTEEMGAAEALLNSMADLLDALGVSIDYDEVDNAWAQMLETQAKLK